jgi:Tetratricopeptide repeat
MSVILDSLRRGRRRQETATIRSIPSRPAAIRLPTGLGLGSTAVAPVRSERARWVGIAAILVIALSVWAVIQVARGLIAPEPAVRPAAATSTRPAPVAASLPAPPPPVAVLPQQTPQPESTTQPARPATVSKPEPTTQIPAPVMRASTPAPTSPSPDTQTGRPSHFDQALRAQRAGNAEEAARHYLAAIADDNRNVEARNNLGLLYRSRGLTAQAIEQFRQALAVDPRYVNARNSLAVLLMDDGRFSQARDELTAGLAVDSRNVDLLVNLALVENSDRHPDRALELLLRAVGERPTHAAAHYNLALLYEQRDALPLAYDHYTDFLKYAGPEYRAVVPDVRRRLETLAPLVSAHTK